MKLKILPLAVSAAMLLVLPLYASDSAQGLFDRAISLKVAAIQQNAADERNDAGAQTSAALFEASARLFEADAAKDWHNWYEAGNARWWAGQSDRAILDYRRYLANDPFRGEVWENLSQARLAAGTVNPGHEGFLAWPWLLWFASGAAFAAGLSALSFSLYLFFRKKSWRTAAISLLSAAFCLALGSATSLASAKSVAVVVAETQGRKGDSSVYAPFPAAPWKAGQEVLVTGFRDTWTRVLAGNVVSWVPSDSLVRVFTARRR